MQLKIELEMKKRLKKYNSFTSTDDIATSVVGRQETRSALTYGILALQVSITLNALSVKAAAFVQTSPCFMWDKKNNSSNYRINMYTAVRSRLMLHRFFSAKGKSL